MPDEKKPEPKLVVIDGQRDRFNEKIALGRDNLYAAAITLVKIDPGDQDSIPLRMKLIEKAGIASILDRAGVSPRRAAGAAAAAPVRRPDPVMAPPGPPPAPKSPVEPVRATEEKPAG